MARVTLLTSAREEFDALPKTIRNRITRLFERLEHWPDVSGARPLSGELAGRWRLRTGDYRLQFQVTGGCVVGEKSGHRDRFYEE
jgi:mRNA-degrading endonuclease RelE of RelBE toxin-antitoxin system